MSSDGISYTQCLKANFTACLLNTYVGFGSGSPYGAQDPRWKSITVKTLRGWYTLSVIGDSIGAGQGASTGNGFVDLVTDTHNSGHIAPINHSVGGQKVISDMATQVTAAASDNADIIITQLGTNDTETDLTAAYQSGLETLHTNNPSAAIYCMGVLPKQDDSDRAAKNASIVAAVNGAVAAGVPATYWSTDGWITFPADFTDSMHPNTQGHAKIAAEVLARL